MRRLTAAITVLVMVAALFGGLIQPVAAQTSGTTYTVQPGDNLYRIGLKFGVSADALAKANGIVNPNIILVGQKLIIPGGTGAPAATTAAPAGTEAAGGGTSATAVPGTTLDAGIISTPTSTSAVPPTTVPTAVPAATSTLVPTPATVPSAPAQTYTVVAGDNLYRISVKFGTSMQAIMQLNNIANPNLIFVGQVLTLPSTSVTTANATSTAMAAGPTITPGGPTVTAGATTAATVAAPTEVGTPTNTAGNVGFQYGVVVDMNGQDQGKLVNAAKDLGMAWVRLPVSWRKMELTKGSIDTSSLDPQIDALAGQSVKILLTVTSAPDWARQTTTESGPPSDFNDYANFVSALATKYKGKVQAYEIWNEPNLRREWSGRPLSAASYVEMLRLAYSAIKRADSSALVISAGLSPTGFNDGVNAINDRVFLRQAFAAGLATYSDAVGAHPGGWANPPDSTCCIASPGVSGWFNDRTFYFRDTIKDYRDIMVQNGHGSTFMWVTQFGWGSSEGVVSDPNQVSATFGFVKFTSQLQQGQYESRAFQLAKTLGYIGPMFVFNLNYCQTVGTDPTNSEFSGCYYSLLDANGNPRPAYDAIKTTPKQ